jgi:hypothetical protein
MNNINNIKNNSMVDVNNKDIKNPLSDNLEDMYIENDIETKSLDMAYICDNNFLFKEIINNILGSNNDKIDFDSDCINVEMSISTNDDYTVIEYIDNINNKQQYIIDDFFNDPSKYINDNPSTNIITEYVPDKNNNTLNDITNVDNDTAIDNNVDMINADNDVNDESENDTNDDVDNELENDVNDDANHEAENDTNDDFNDDIDDDLMIYEDIYDSIKNIQQVNFFDCFNEKNAINSSISCMNMNKENESKLNELTTSYMFDTEDLKKLDVVPFDDDINNLYERNKKNKKVMGRASVIAVSALMLVSGSWINNIINSF